MVRPSHIVVVVLSSLVVVPAAGAALGSAGPVVSLLQELSPLTPVPAPAPAGGDPSVPAAPGTDIAPPPASIAAPDVVAPPLPAAPPAPAAPEAPAALPDLLPGLSTPAPLRPRMTNDTVVSDAPRDALGRGGSAGGASGGSVAAPGAPAPSLGSQTVAADMGPQEGIGPSVQRGAADALTGPGSWYDALPPEAKGPASALVGLLMTGLAVAGAYVMGFRHIGRDNLLEHNTRAELLEVVRTRPGIHLRELARSMGMTATNAGYHLRVLERHGLVRSARQNGKRVYVPAGSKDMNQRNMALALLRRDSRAQVAAALLAHPGINQLRLAQATGQHQGAVSWHVRRLVEAGVVTEERTPRECRYALTPLGMELVRQQLAEEPRTLHVRAPGPAMAEALPAAAVASASPQLVAAVEPTA